MRKGATAGIYGAHSLMTSSHAEPFVVSVSRNEVHTETEPKRKLTEQMYKLCIILKNIDCQNVISINIRFSVAIVYKYLQLSLLPCDLKNFVTFATLLLFSVQKMAAK